MEDLEEDLEADLKEDLEAEAHLQSITSPNR